MQNQTRTKNIKLIKSKTQGIKRDLKTAMSIVISNEQNTSSNVSFLKLINSNISDERKCLCQKMSILMKPASYLHFNPNGNYSINTNLYKITPIYAMQ